MMKELELKATPIDRYIVTTDSNHQLNVYPNLINRPQSIKSE